MKANDDVVLSTGQIKQTDTTVVFITVEDIRKANIKLIERMEYKYLAEVRENKINELNALINVKQDRIDIINSDNNNLRILVEEIKTDNEEKQRQINRLKYITIGSVSINVAIIIGLLIL